MAAKFTRSDLRKILGEAHTEEIENQIMSLHLGVVDGLKDALSKAQTDAERLPKVQEELDKLKKDQGNDSSWEEKYNKEHAALENLKKEQAEKEEKSNKTAKYRELLKKAGISEKRLDTVLKVTDISKIKLDKDGNIEDSENLLSNIKTEWADFIVKEGTKGAKTGNPPGSTGTKLTKEEIYKTDEKGRFIMDAQARQAALAELQASEE